MTPLVTVIIPTYNYALFISNAIEAILSQTYAHWECIVVDDGSTDKTLELVNQYVSIDERIRYIQQKNAGPSAARNNGLKNCNGKYIQFLDADDLIAPAKLSKQVQFLEENPQVDIIYSDVRYFQDDYPDQLLYSMSKPDRPWMPMVSGSGKAILIPLLHQNIMVSNAPLLRRSVVEDVGFFDESLEAFEDWHYWLRCADSNKHFEFRDFEGTLALVRLHRSSTSQSGRRKITASALLDMWRKANISSTDHEVLETYRNSVAHSERGSVFESAKEANLSDALYDIIRVGIKHRRYKWIIKHVALACIGRL